MGWYTDIQAILKQEPETWLAYLYGQQLEKIPHLTRIKPRWRGGWWRLCIYFYFLARHVKLRMPAEYKTKVDYVFFSGTMNQMASLSGTANALKGQGKRLLEISDRHLLQTEELRARYIPVSFYPLDIIKSLVLLVVNGPSLYKELKSAHPAAIQNYFNSFCSVYIFLVYFYGLLKRAAPDYVVTANDHNAPNRALLAVAHYLGVKTVYLQHASVSALFPALRVNYAFLDGQRALDVYRECEKNQPPTTRKVPTPRVFLTGQKKELVRSVAHKATSIKATSIGIALNALDEPSGAIQLVKELVSTGQELRVRWHPGQPRPDIQRYRTSFAGMPHIKLSDPELEPLPVFFEKIYCLIAGNSSIHLEAALANVVPIYYEISPSDIPDYYGYVSSGLAYGANSVVEIMELVRDGARMSAQSIEAVRYYSATYLTEWQHREGELVGRLLLGDSEDERWIGDDKLTIRPMSVVKE